MTVDSFIRYFSPTSLKYREEARIETEGVLKFVEQHGLVPAKTMFTLRALRDGKVWSDRQTKYQNCYPNDIERTLDSTYAHPYMDHPYFFRDKNRKAAAIVAHLYSVPKDIHEWADKLGLDVEIRSREESWYYPGVTTVVVFRSKRLN